MDKFIIRLLNCLGMGVNGFIANMKSVKAREIFPDYSFDKTADTGTEATFTVTDVETGKRVFSLVCGHKENGRITEMTLIPASAE